MQIIKPSIDENLVCIASIAQFIHLQNKHHGTFTVHSNIPYLGNYEGECFFVEPEGMTDEQREIWIDACLNAEGSFDIMMGHDADLSTCRMLLPNSVIIQFKVPIIYIGSVSSYLGIANE